MNIFKSISNFIHKHILNDICSYCNKKIEKGYISEVSNLCKTCDKNISELIHEFMKGLKYEQQ
jgi:predicted amidophosphoribosyltransferase